MTSRPQSPYASVKSGVRRVKSVARPRLVESAAEERGRLQAEKPGEFLFEDQYDYVTFVSARLRTSHMKYSHVAAGGGMSPSTVSNMASGKTRLPRFGTITGILGALGYETVIRAGRRK